MTSSLQDFAFSISLDCGLLRQSLAAGETVPPAEILSLAAAVEAIYISVTLESRQLDRVDACHKLWSQAAELFAELTQAWVDVASNDTSIIWLRGRITHFADLASDRAQLYSVNEKDRRKYREGREIGSEYSFSNRDQIPA